MEKENEFTKINNNYLLLSFIYYSLLESQKETKFERDFFLALEDLVNSSRYNITGDDLCGGVR